MPRRTLFTAALLASLLACGDNDPVAEGSSNPDHAQAAADTAAAADSTAAPEFAALADSAGALLKRGERPTSSVCARRLAELREVRADLAKADRPRRTSLRSKELMLSAVISDACY